jgi:hypothetical protein
MTNKTTPHSNDEITKKHQRKKLINVKITMYVLKERKKYVEE